MLCAQILSSIYSTFSTATQDTKQMKTAKGKKEMSEISISERRNDRNGKQTNTLQCRIEMTEDWRHALCVKSWMTDKR